MTKAPAGRKQPAAKGRTQRPYAGSTDNPDPSPPSDPAKRLAGLKMRFPAIVQLANAQAKAADAQASIDRATALLHPPAHDVVVPHVRARTAHDALELPRDVEQDGWEDPADADKEKWNRGRITGYRAVDPLMRAFRTGTTITRRHVNAANKLRNAYAVGVLGAKPGRGGFFKVGSAPQFSAGEFASADRLAKLREVGDVLHLVGKMGSAILMHVVLSPPDPDRPRDPATFAKRLGVRAEVMMGMLAAALERVAEYYDPPVTNPMHDEEGR